MRYNVHSLKITIATKTRNVKYTKLENRKYAINYENSMLVADILENKYAKLEIRKYTNDYDVN